MSVQIKISKTGYGLVGWACVVPNCNSEQEPRFWASSDNDASGISQGQANTVICEK